MQLLKTSSDWDKLCKSVKERGAKLDGDIHVLACSALSLTKDDRNTTRLSRLVSAMPKSARGKALVDWIEKFFPATVEYGTGKVTNFAKQDSDAWKEYLGVFDDTLADAIATPFWELKPEKGAKDVLNLDFVLKFLERKAVSKDADATTASQIKALIKFGESLKTGAQLELPLPGEATPESRPAVH